MGRLTVNYYPSPAQLAFHQDRGKYLERLLQAGTAGGKTYCAGFEVTDITLREDPDVGVIAAPNYPQLELSVFPTFRRLFGRDISRLEPLARYNQQRKTLKWANGWEWRFASMDDPTSVEGLPEAAFVWLNEARLVKDFGGEDGPWFNLTRRLRGANPRRRHAIADTHSPTRGIMSVFKSAPRPPLRVRVKGGTYYVQDCEDPQRRTYQWGTKDAMAWRTLDPEAGARIVAQYHGSAATRILEGRYARPGGLVFDAFGDRNIRKWNRSCDRMSYGVDWGWTHPTAITAHAWLGDKVHSIDEAGSSSMQDKDILKAILALQDAYGEGTVWCGPDRPEGIRFLRRPPAEFKLPGVDARPYVGKVEDGVTALNSRAGAGSWVVDPACKFLLLGLEEWERDRETGLVKKQDGADDFPDSARYGIQGELARRPATAHENPEGDGED